MQDLANLLPKNGTASIARPSPTSSPASMSLPPPNDGLLEKLFRAMKAEFGGRWSSQSATPADMAALKTEWWARIHDLTPAQIRRGMEAMTVGQDAFPPGPRAFRRLCLAGEEMTRRGIHALYLPAPPRAPMDRATVVAGLAALRAQLPADEALAGEYIPAQACTPAERRRWVNERREELVRAGLERFIEQAA